MQWNSNISTPPPSLFGENFLRLHRKLYCSYAPEYTYARLLCVIQKVQFLLESQMTMILGIAIEAVIATMFIKSPIIYFH